MAFKHSKYNIPIKMDEDIFVIFNTFTQGLLEVNTKIYNEFLDLKTDSKKVQNKFLEYGFWIPNEFDEINELQLMHRKARYANDLVNVTIKTTNACNFLCSYCYQDHVPVELTTETIEKLIAFFEDQINNKGVSNIFIHWFGGEPLLNMEAILKIESYLNRKIASNELRSFRSALTSNGYLLNEDIINKISQTKIESIQVTVDGIKDQHNRSRVLPTGDGTFDVIISNIKRCLELIPTMRFIIRLNVNKANQNVDAFLEFLQKNDLKKDNIGLHFSEAQKHEITYTTEDIFYKNLREYAAQKLKIYKSLVKYGYKIPTNMIRGYNCEFDCIHNFLIDTDANVYLCSSTDSQSDFHLGEITSEGLVKHNQVNFTNKMLREPFQKKKCVQCKVLPMCMGGCTYLEKVNKEECIPEKYFIEDLVKLYYESNV